VFRFGNGDKKELEPEPEQIRLHTGFIRIKEMSKKVEERARESYPEHFQDVSKIARSAAAGIK
jgi:hypothetical protein